MSMENDSIKQIREMQYEIDEYYNFIEHLFLLLTVNPDREIMAGHSRAENLMVEICLKINELLRETGRKTNGSN